MNWNLRIIDISPEAHSVKEQVEEFFSEIKKDFRKQQFDLEMIDMEYIPNKIANRLISWQAYQPELIEWLRVLYTDKSRKLAEYEHMVVFALGEL